MNVKLFRELMTADMLMGPNSLRILEELFQRHPLSLPAGENVLDLGCGKGLTSYAIAKETEATVYANDLWIAAEENARRFAAWGISEQVIPVHEDANQLTFAPKTFSALISIDAYHYFATGASFFEEKILPFLKDGAAVWIGIPGVKDVYAGRSEELLPAWLGDEAYMFKSPSEWKAIIGTSERIEQLETWEMNCFDQAWSEWFATGHKYAIGDQQFFETLIKPYTCFVGIHVKIK